VPVTREDLAQNLVSTKSTSRNGVTLLISLHLLCTLVQADYLLQRLGGEPYYSKNHGIPSLVLAHMHIELTPRVAERWMDHFEESLYDMHEEMASSHKDMIRDHMRFQAYFLVAAQMLQRDYGSRGVQFLD